MGKGYLIDSNAVIDFFNKSMPNSGRELLQSIDPHISIVTQIEIFSNNQTKEEEVTQLNTFTSIATIYPLDHYIAIKAIDLRLLYKIKLPDAVLAATAMHYDLILVTRNASDFSKIKGLEIINPHII